MARPFDSAASRSWLKSSFNALFDSPRSLPDGRYLAQAMSAWHSTNASVARTDSERCHPLCLCLLVGMKRSHHFAGVLACICCKDTAARVLEARHVVHIAVDDDPGDPCADVFWSKRAKRAKCDTMRAYQQSLTVLCLATSSAVRSPLGGCGRSVPAGLHIPGMSLDNRYCMYEYVHGTEHFY